MLRQRLAAAALGLPMLFLMLWLNWFLRRAGNPDDLPVLVMVLIIAGAAGLEVSKVVKQRYPGAHPLNGLYAALIIPFLVHAIGLDVTGSPASLGLFIDSIGIVAAVMLLGINCYSDIERRKLAGFVENLIVLAAGFYLGGTLSCLLLLCRTPLHEIAVGFIFVLVFGLDTAAYFGGKHFGGRPLAPKISPKKTVSGSICGLLATIGLAFIFKAVPAATGTADTMPAWWNLGAHLPWAALLWMGVSAGILGQAGDLLESAFKRWGRVKDSGTIIPGHGGFLDRFDSLFLTAPICYLLFLLFLKLPH
ncbi:MAG: phosphatidate cytidylyltransferase [Armatimonadota bacterium]